MSALRPPVGPLKAPRKLSVEEAELQGGLRSLVARHNSVPLVEVRLVFPLSGRQIKRSAEPLVLSESLLAGTTHHDRMSLAEAVGRLGGTLGANAAGDTFVLYGSAFANRFRQLLELMNEVLTSATYQATEVEGDRQRSADEITLALSRPETVASEALGRRLYGEHPYGAPLPRPGEISAVAAPKLRRLHTSLLHPEGAHLVVVGDISAKKVTGLVEEVFSEWLARPGSGRANLPRVPALEPEALELVDRKGAVQSNIRIGGQMPGRLDESWPAVAVANAILGGMFTSRIVENLRERNGYTYNAYSAVRHLRAGSTGTISADVSTDVTAAALVEARYEIARLATAGVSEQELEASRRYLVGIFLFQTATQAGLASMLGALAVAGAGPGYLTSHPAQLAKTTKAEVDEAARRFYAPSRLATVVVGGADAVMAQLEDLGEVQVSEPD